MSDYCCDICGKDCITLFNGQKYLKFEVWHCYPGVREQLKVTGISCSKECEEKWQEKYGKENDRITEEYYSRNPMTISFHGSFENEEIRKYKAESLCRLSRKNTRWLHHLKKSGTMRDLLQQRKQEKARAKR